VSELSALHTFVVGGDLRKGQDQIEVASLGARLTRDDAAGGYRVEHIYRTDPDQPNKLSPLLKQGVDVSDGDVITAINGQPVLPAAAMGELLRGQAGKTVLVTYRPRDKTETHHAVVHAMSTKEEDDLRYSEWEYSRRLQVEQASGGHIGYVHLRAMGASDMERWVEEYTPIFDRDGLIVDVRHNFGGNIDSWILDRLSRKAWMYWQARHGVPSWNMQEAFRGHLVVLCDQVTASDGEAFTEGFKRLGLGKVIGTRTWGGEIWLSGSNVLADNGIASAAEFGVFGPEREWLIEGRGVAPDMVVDNLPHSVFEGTDAQLDAAISFLQGEIKNHPTPVPVAPKYPDKSVSWWLRQQR
jgi:tricorn protease